MDITEEIQNIENLLNTLDIKIFYENVEELLTKDDFPICIYYINVINPLNYIANKINTYKVNYIIKVYGKGIFETLLIKEQISNLLTNNFYKVEDNYMLNQKTDFKDINCFALEVSKILLNE